MHAATTSGKVWVGAIDFSEGLPEKAIAHKRGWRDIGFTPSLSFQARMKQMRLLEDEAGLRDLLTTWPDVHALYLTLKNPNIEEKPWICRVWGLSMQDWSGLPPATAPDPDREWSRLAAGNRLDRYRIALSWLEKTDLKWVTEFKMKRLFSHLCEHDQKSLLVYINFGFLKLGNVGMGHATTYEEKLRNLEYAWRGASERVQAVTWPAMLKHVFTLGRIEGIQACEQWGHSQGWRLRPVDYEMALRRVAFLDGMDSVVRYCLREHRASAYPLLKFWLSRPVRWCDEFLTSHFTEPSVTETIDRLVHEGMEDRVPKAAAMRRAHLRENHLSQMLSSQPLRPMDRHRRRS